jgi:hypothetical protein
MMGSTATSKQALLFLQKKKQKSPWPEPVPLHAPQSHISKSFLLLVFKKEVLSYFAAP